MSTAPRSHIPAGAQEPPADRDPRMRYARRPKYSLQEHHRWNQSRTNRKNIPHAREITAKTTGIIHKTQTIREDGNMLFVYAYPHRHLIFVMISAQ